VPHANETPLNKLISIHLV